MDYAQRKSIRGNLSVSNYVMVAISMPSIYTAGEFKTNTDAWEKRTFNAKVCGE